MRSAKPIYFYFRLSNRCTNQEVQTCKYFGVDSISYAKTVTDSASSWTQRKQICQKYLALFMYMTKYKVVRGSGKIK